jgi:hypothetical protein
VPHTPKARSIGELVGKGGAFVISLPWRRSNYERTQARLLAAGVAKEVVSYIRALDGLSAGMAEMSNAMLSIQTQNGETSLMYRLPLDA